MFLAYSPNRCTMGLIEYLPSREAGGAIRGTPEEMDRAREANRWLRETPQGRASMEDVIEYVREMVRKDREELEIG